MRWRLLLTCLELLCLIVGASSDGFYFTVNPNDQDVEEGEALRLRCAVTPSKDIFYSWLHNGDRVEPDQEYGRRYLEAESNLQIPHADRELDQGTYQCQALNKSSTFTTASQEAKVNIYWIEPYVQVILIKPTRYEDLRLGQEVEFACQASANPPITSANIKWYHNGNARLPNTKFLPNGNLLISVLGVEHTGSYHCRVVHAAGKLDSRPPFVVQFNEAKSLGPITSLNHHDFSRFVMRGHSLELTCPKMGEQKSVDGIPPITVWVYMPRLGEQQQSVTTLPDIKLLDMDSKLVITNFEAHHVNYYTCEIGSHVSPDRYVFLFQVEMATLYAPKRSDFSPRLKKNQPYVVKIGHDAELRYYPDNSPSNSFLIDQISNPTPQIEWRKKGEPQSLLAWPPLSAHGNHEHSAFAGDHSTPRIYVLRGRHLVVRRAVESDAGVYEMILSNVAGRSSISFDLIVTFPPEFYNPQTPEEHSFDEDDSVILSCGVKRRAIPGSTVYWEKDQRVLRTNTNSLMVMENNGESLRFPKLKPEDQGQYQCFVQTEGYAKRTAGREQTLVVKGKLQFVRDMRDYFLEMNSLGRIPCKVRGYGSLTVDWYRKVGPRPSDVQPIRAPNHVEPGGTLVMQYVQKADAGDYVCIAQSTYKNSRINVTVNVVVGEKPQISHISPNQTVRVGSHLILNCHATGDPVPQISWIAKRAGFVMYTPQSETIDQSSASLDKTHESLDRNPMDGSDHGSSDSTLLDNDPMMTALLTVQSAPGSKGRVTAYTNGSLVINQASLSDQAEYICVANNKHAVETRQGLFVRVLTVEEYTRRQLGGDAANSGMLKTILTVVGCAVTYLGLIIALTVFCSIRLVRKRGKRQNKGGHMPENGQLLTPMGEPNISNGITGTIQPGSNTMDPGFMLPVISSCVNSNGSGQYAQLHNQHGQPLLTNISGQNSGSFGYPETGFHLNTLPYRSAPSDGLTTAGLQNQNRIQSETQEWWPWKTHGYFNPLDVQPKVPHGTPASPLDITSESAVENAILKPQRYAHTHPLNPTPCSYIYNGHTSATGADNSTTATSTSEPLIMSAPPPTPLDSRSHFSGLSSGNSTSLYSRSVLSGASNVGTHIGGGQIGGETSPINGVSNSPMPITQMDRMHYPRCELKVEGVLGKGVFGDVFLARARHIRDEEAQSLVLVKSLTSHEPLHVNEFHRQVELFGKLNHDNVTRLLGISMEQEPFYMLLEYCEWGDLKTFLRRIREGDHPPFKLSTLNCEQKLRMCQQICSGMDHLSHLRCVHRDLAARNILLTQDMELKISSLGLCRDIHSSEYFRIPNTDQFIPLRWFAPELIAEALPPIHNNPSSRQLDYGHMFAGPSLPYSVQSDIWAFAILICEIFAMAMLPLSRLSDQEIITAGKQAAAQASQNCTETGLKELSPLRPDIPAEVPLELATLLNQCWSPAPRHRPGFGDLCSVLSDLVS